MITYQNNKFWQRPWFLAVIGGTAVAAAAWWWMGSKDSASGQQANNTTNGGWFTPSSEASHGNAASGNTQGSVLTATRPADLPEADWNALKGALSKTMPQAEAEAARVADYLQYQKRFEYWQTTEGSKSAKERASLAEALLQEIPARLAKGEFTVGEAMLMNTVLITESEPNEAARQQRITEMQAKLLKLGPPQDNPKLLAEAERATEQKRLVATTFAEWQARPEGQRTQAALEAALADAQRAFNSGSQQ